MQGTVTPLHRPPDTKARLNRRIEGTGWALLLIVIGCLVWWESAPEGTWLVGTGLILLGVNAARYVNDIPTNAFTVGLGALAILLGLGKFLGLALPVLPLLLILIGMYILYRTVIEPERLS